MIEVSVIIVVRNAELYILNCIKSIESQFSNNQNWELIIVDGVSTDKTKQIVEDYLKKQTYNNRIIDNPKKTLAPGWNLGIKAAEGTYVCRPDAHASLHRNYIKNGVELHNSINAIAIGGILETKSNSFLGGIIKEALSLKIGVGNSFRTLKTSCYTDTAVYAVYKKAIFSEVGYFNESLIRHQDNEMHRRIKLNGGDFYTSTTMIADYYCRDTIFSLLKQMYNIGKYLPDVFERKSISLRHLIPFLFFAGIITGGVLSFFSSALKYFYFSILFFYFILIFLESSKRVFQNKKISIYLTIIIIPLIHLVYGFGTFIGLIKKI